MKIFKLLQINLKAILIFNEKEINDLYKNIVNEYYF